MSDSFKFIIIGILIIFIAFSNIEISYASSSPMDVSDNTTHVRLQTIINWLNNFLVYHYDYYNGIHQSNLESIVSKLSGISSTTALTDQKVEQIYYSVDQVESYLTNIQSNTSNIKDYTNILNSIDSDLNINWTKAWDFLGVRKTIDGSYVSQSSSNINLGQNQAYLVFGNPNNFIQETNIFKIFVPVAGYWDPDRNDLYDIEFIYRYKNNGNQYIFTPDSLNLVQSYRGILITFTGFSPMWEGAEFIIHLTNNGPYNSLVYYANAVGSFNYIPINDRDYFDSLSSLYLYTINKNIDQITSLYASDDLIAAKQNQKQFEDQAINDFTGNGTAASSTSDINSLKGVSNTLKNGINTGGSVNNALSVFSNSNSIWDWFKQDNYNNINNQYNSNSNRLLRSNSGSNYIIDFYSQNQNEVFESLGD